MTFWDPWRRSVPEKLTLRLQRGHLEGPGVYIYIYILVYIYIYILYVYIIVYYYKSQASTFCIKKLYCSKCNVSQSGLHYLFRLTESKWTAACMVSVMKPLSYRSTVVAVPNQRAKAAWEFRILCFLPLKIEQAKYAEIMVSWSVLSRAKMWGPNLEAWHPQ